MWGKDKTIVCKCYVLDIVKKEREQNKWEKKKEIENLTYGHTDNR